MIEVLRGVDVHPPRSVARRRRVLHAVNRTSALIRRWHGKAGGPRELIRAMAKIQSQSTSNPCSISQAAAAEALNGPQTVVAERSDAFQARRDLVVERLNACPGLSCRMPEGAFYVYPSCAGLIGCTAPDGSTLASDEDVVRYLLTEANVACVPGAAFGLSPTFACPTPRRWTR